MFLQPASSVDRLSVPCAPRTPRFSRPPTALPTVPRRCGVEALASSAAPPALPRRRRPEGRANSRPAVALAVPAAPPRAWGTWQPSLATTVATLGGLGTSAAWALWRSDNSAAALTYAAVACMTGAVLMTHATQAAWTRANQSVERTLGTAARTAEEVLPQLTQTVLQALDQTRYEVSEGLEEATCSVNKTLETAAQGICSSLGQLGRTAGVLLGTVTALYVLGRLGAPLLLAAAAGKGGIALAAWLGGWSLGMLVLGWWVPRCLL